MANQRLESFTTIPNVELDSLLFIESNALGSFQSHKVPVSTFKRIEWSAPVSTNTILTTGQAQMVDTSGGSVTLTLPGTPNVNDVVHFGDYAGTFEDDNCIIDRNGENIEGLAENLNANINGFIGKLTFIDSSRGWRVSQ